MHDSQTDPIGRYVADRRFRMLVGGELVGAEGAATAVALVASLRCADDVAQDTEVGSVRLVTHDGAVIERSLRAGVDIAERAHERPDVKDRVNGELDGMKGKVAGFSGTAVIDRTKFGLVWNMPVPGGVLVSEKLKVDFDLQATEAAASGKTAAA